MARRKRTPNTSLSALLREAHWGNDQLARAVNITGAEAGLSLSYDKTSVAHWLTGSRPKGPVREVVREAFARRLGRPVTSSEAFADEAEAETDTVSGLVELGTADMDPSRRAVLTAGLYSAALVLPGFTDEFTDATGRIDHSRRADRTVHIGAGEVATVNTMTDRIASILDELGAAHARPMAAAFLVSSVGPWLRASGTEDTKRQLLAAASDLTYLTGWMAMYETAHGLGQRYYVQALKLASEAGDKVTYCRTLRGMALQASSLGYGSRTLELADAAAEASPQAGPRLQAFLSGQQAHGAAMVGDRRMAFQRLQETETSLSRADGRNDAVGGYDAAAYHFHASHVLYELGDLPGSIRELTLSNRVRLPGERQGRVHAMGLLARRQMELGHVEESCRTWGLFLDDYTGISSVRGDEHFRLLRSELGRHQTVRAVAEITPRVRTVARLKAA